MISMRRLGGRLGVCVFEREREREMRDKESILCVYVVYYDLDEEAGWKTRHVFVRETEKKRELISIRRLGGRLCV